MTNHFLRVIETPGRKIKRFPESGPTTAPPHQLSSPLVGFRPPSRTRPSRRASPPSDPAMGSPWRRKKREPMAWLTWARKMPHRRSMAPLGESGAESFGVVCGKVAFRRVRSIKSQPHSWILPERQNEAATTERKGHFCRKSVVRCWPDGDMKGCPYSGPHDDALCW